MNHEQKIDQLLQQKSHDKIFEIILFAHFL